MEGAADVKLHALKRVGSFAGDTDVERWIDKMELALRIDGIPTSRHADVISLHLEGAAYDTWKGLSAEKRMDAEAIKAELRTVFGLQRMDAWALATSQGSLAPGDTVDVAFEELRKLVGIAIAGDDTVGQVAACLLTSRLPPHVQEQVLLQCGKDLAPAAVVACAKQLMTVNAHPARAFSAMANKKGPPSGLRPDQCKGRPKWSETRRCFNCHQPGHIARDCTAATPAHSAVPGNGGAGQPLV